MRIMAWALFDLANTFFAVAMLTFYFPLWLIEDRGAEPLTYSLAVGASMLIVALLMPVCGAISDASGERLRYLRWTTYACAAATAGIGFTQSVPLALGLFIFANIGYQLGTIFYDAMLWSVTSGKKLGQTSGLGAAFGYVGSMVGLLALWPFVTRGGYQASFMPSAVCFLMLALPCFLLLREPSGAARMPWASLWKAGFSRMSATLRQAKSQSGLWRFFWASFFSMSAIHTILFFMAVYTRTVLGLTMGELIRFFLVCQAVTVCGALSFGYLIPRWGAKRTLMTIWCGWIVSLALVALNLSMRWLWVVGPLIGFCLGSTFATARVFLLELAPKAQLAEMVGLAGLFTRTSAILGPVIWSLLVSEDRGYAQGFIFLILLLGIGIWLLQGVPATGTASARTEG